MNTATLQREIQEWYNMWGKIHITRDNIQQLCRGPLKDFQNFLSRQGRPDGFIETMRTNIYLNTGTQDEAIAQEIDDTVFASQMKTLKELEAELKEQQVQVQNKFGVLDKLDIKEMKNRNFQSFKKTRLKRCINKKIKETSLVLSAIEKPDFISVESVRTSVSEGDNEESKETENDNNKHLESLSNVAHLAFQSVILRHYISEQSLHSSPYGMPTSTLASAAGEFVSLVAQVMNEKSYGKAVACWIRQEWLDHIQSCFRKQQLQVEQDHPSIAHNMSSKTRDTILMWSQNHMQTNAKNKTRQKLLKDTKVAVQSHQNAGISNPNIGYRISDLLSIIRRVTLSAEVVRCRQHANKTINPIENIFKNVSFDHCKSPMVAGRNLDDIMRNFDFNRNQQSWVSTISKPEHLLEIFGVLQKTWSTVKHDLSSIVSLANESGEGLPNLILTMSKYSCTSGTESTGRNGEWCKY